MANDLEQGMEYPEGIDSWLGSLELGSNCVFNGDANFIKPLPTKVRFHWENGYSESKVSGTTEYPMEPGAPVLYDVFIPSATL